MTIPTTHNCPHDGSGWCLDCVGRLAVEHNRLREASARLCRELECPAMEYLHGGVRNAWAKLCNLLDGPAGDDE